MMLNNHCYGVKRHLSLSVSHSHVCLGIRPLLLKVGSLDSVLGPCAEPHRGPHRPQAPLSLGLHPCLQLGRLFPKEGRSVCKVRVPGCFLTGFSHPSLPIPLQSPCTSPCPTNSTPGATSTWPRQTLRPAGEAQVPQAASHDCGACTAPRCGPKSSTHRRPQIFTVHGTQYL